MIEYQIIINLLAIHLINQLNLRQKNGLKYMMTHVERIAKIAKLNLKLQC